MKKVSKFLSFLLAISPPCLRLTPLPAITAHSNNNQTTMMNQYTINQLKAQLRSGEFAWPGGYPLFFFTSDGEALSFGAVRENIKSVIWSIRHKVNDGWRVIGCDVNWEDDSMTCAHTGEPIESAYGEAVEA